MKTVYHKGELIPVEDYCFEHHCPKPKKVSKKAPKVEAETQPGVVDFHQD